MKAITIDDIVARWSDPAARPLFKGKLIDEDGCCCAQGDVLRLCGWTDDRLRKADQHIADRAVAGALGISVTHAVLLRIVNDREDGCPQDVLTHPERVLGDQAPRIMAFWKRLDSITPTVRAAAARKPMQAAGPAIVVFWEAGEAAEKAAEKAAGAVAMATARAVAGNAGANHEIQGAAHLTSFYFLPMFGIADPAELDE